MSWQKKRSFFSSILLFESTLDFHQRRDKQELTMIDTLSHYLNLIKDSDDKQDRKLSLSLLPYLSFRHEKYVYRSIAAHQLIFIEKNINEDDYTSERFLCG